MITRRGLLHVAAAPLAGLPSLAGETAAFPKEAPTRALVPCPGNEESVRVNPPGFAWWRARGASTYRLSVQDASGAVVFEAADLKDPVCLPDKTFPRGAYRWNVEAVDASGKVLDRRGEWRFEVTGQLPSLPWEDPRALIARLPGAHPRYIFTAAELPKLRQSLKAGRRRAWEQLRPMAEKALATPLPEPPRYHTFDGPVRQRMGYTFYFRDFRRVIDAGMSVLTLAYLLSGDERYGLAAKKILLEVESWGVEGPMSVSSPFGGEPGLSMARHGHRAYDWLYPLLDENERARVRQMTIDRARQVLTRLKKADYLATPAESHNGRMIAYLTEYAVVVKDEAPDSHEWLDYSLRALTTFYPHWGDADGGWAEGVSYALSYNSLYLPAIESLRTGTGFDLYRRPFFRNVRRFFLYCTSPVGEVRPFGDGGDRGGVGAQGAALMTHHGRRFSDSASLWWAEQTGDSAVGSDPLIGMLTEDNVKAAPPTRLPFAAQFRGVGWAALHGALDRPHEDTFLLFKSSPYGSVSHSHGDQNAFAILKGGRALAVPSGHYGPAYGMPHHAQWTRQTKAHNCVLVDGQGQVVREPWAKGRISGFRHQQALSYVCGDAAAAYGGKLTGFRRHILFLRPGVFVLLDELEAPQPAGYEWLLHALEKMSVDEAQQMVVSTRGDASLTVRLSCDAGLSFHQTDQFDTPFNEGNPPEYHTQMPNHWHFRAATRRQAARLRIAASIVVRGKDEGFEAQPLAHAGWSGIRLETSRGAGEAWVQYSTEAAPPAGVPAERKIFARWQPKGAAAETFGV